ncbi:hypothetical protein COU16_03230 [Candidatus Kaiserbacteria bacterium CG10_big_fil_rev_8_21_14_0_10_47_16]|uniref:Carboxypeptidase regulatory-like domain-containing protein n=1 Tax=Candidatus Kaiserbacteria bacterium CG10_big_fil_rev_8_21_14_0_10_47_16 TaxID=1974608 RepID=A0A2H0UDR5_9BACT|nr:MAG: hypothetical protein COU16_03230 [Candidatus Kaiserbacteria bacterium CG10_big_fil_rev_8_21_14_0_10_47_16]
MSFVEVIVAAAVLVLVFGGLFASFQLMTSLIGKSKVSAGALALANQQMEAIRALTYNDVGTIGGIPDGAIPETSTTTLNGITYVKRVLVAYVDSPDDGEGAADENGIVADYKVVKVTYSWDYKGVSDSISLISNIVPQGIETTAGGGTIVVNVFNATVGPVSDAAVRIYNDTGTTTIDTTRYTNAEGKAIISGAPALANYQITVTKTGYSTDGTYVATAENPNPTTPPVAVLASQTSTMNFQIDALSDLKVRTVGEPVVDTFDDTFTDSTKIASQVSTEVVGGALVLTGGPAYVSSGSVQSMTVTPSTFASWDTATFTLTTPANTAATIQVYGVSGGVTTLIPGSDLAGNSTGFTAGTISLVTLDPVTYPALALGASLTTSDASSTPSILDWHVGYVVSEPPIAGEDVILTGSKTIGTDSSSNPVYKYQETNVTNASGEITLTGLEWDVYDVVLNASSYDIKEACSAIPYALDPSVSETLTLTLAADAARTLRVSVVDTAGNAVAGATVALTRPALSESDTTSGCGQVFFNNSLPSASDYQVDVSATGFTSEIVTGVSITDDVTLAVVLTAS